MSNLPRHVLLYAVGHVDQPAPGLLEKRHRAIEIPLPSEQDVDRVMSFLEKAWRRLIDMANRVQKDVSGKI